MEEKRKNSGFAYKGKTKNRAILYTLIPCHVVPKCRIFVFSDKRILYNQKLFVILPTNYGLLQLGELANNCEL